MTALEEIEAAIANLTRLKAESTQWQPDPDMPELAGWYVDSDGSGLQGVFAIKELFRGGHAVALYADPPDAELIVTLHRTIDAQLAILGAASSSILETGRDPEAVYSDGRHMDGARLLMVAPWGRAAVDMARSINGTS